MSDTTQRGGGDDGRWQSRISAREPVDRTRAGWRGTYRSLGTIGAREPGSLTRRNRLTRGDRDQKPVLDRRTPPTLTDYRRAGWRERRAGRRLCLTAFWQLSLWRARG